MQRKIFWLLGVMLIAAACNLTTQQPTAILPTSVPPTTPPPTEVAACFFSAYGIGAPHNIYASPEQGESIARPSRCKRALSYNRHDRILVSGTC